ncbi:MAG: hypothetical protein K1X64_16870 [Myxococcaceae bacterium]|nr:hypothetical protein [Myxococcaceae bacterium]
MKISVTTAAIAGGGVLAVVVVVGAMSLKPVDVPKAPPPKPWSGTAVVNSPPSVAPVTENAPPSNAAASEHSRVAGALDDGARVHSAEASARARMPAPVAIVACEEELATVREMPKEPETFRHATGALNRLHAKLQAVAASSSGEWQVAALVLIGECFTELAERSEAISPTICNDEHLTQIECAELMGDVESRSSREQASEAYKKALELAEAEHIDTAYTRLAKNRLLAQ